jgi:hypothetical protein
MLVTSSGCQVSMPRNDIWTLQILPVYCAIVGDAGTNSTLSPIQSLMGDIQTSIMPVYRSESCLTRTKLRLFGTGVMLVTLTSSGVRLECSGHWNLVEFDH